MISRCCVVLLHLLALLNEALQKEPSVGFIGGSAVLPCFSEAPPRNLQEITVHWRYDDNLNVYDIIKGKGSVDEQHSAYKGRAETFPDEFEKGNFSLKLSNLQNKDAGKYMCYFLKIIKTVELQIKEKEESNQVKEESNQVKEESNPVEEKNSQTAGRNRGAQSRPEKIVTAVLLLPVFILTCV